MYYVQVCTVHCSSWSGTRQRAGIARVASAFFLESSVAAQNWYRTSLLLAGGASRKLKCLSRYTLSYWGSPWPYSQNPCQKLCHDTAFEPFAASAGSGCLWQPIRVGCCRLCPHDTFQTKIAVLTYRHKKSLRSTPNITGVTTVWSGPTYAAVG